MEEKKTIKISLSKFFLIFAIVVIIVMGGFIYKLYNDKQEQSKKIDSLTFQISNLAADRQNLQDKINIISNTINNNISSNSNTSSNSNKEVPTLKPSKKISKLFENSADAEEYVVQSWNGVSVEEFYENEILIGDAVWSGLVTTYKASSTHKKDSANYDAINLNNLYIENCWCEGVSGNGIGETIEVNAFGSCEKVSWGNSRGYEILEDVEDYLLNEYNYDNSGFYYHEVDGKVYEEKFPVITKDNISNYYNKIDQIAIINGYAKTPELWKNNGRVKKLKLTIDDNIEYILELEDTRDLQLFDINYKNEIVTKKINLKFEILEVYPGEKYEDTCLTSLYLSGGTNIPWGGR